MGMGAGIYYVYEQGMNKVSKASDQDKREEQLESKKSKKTSPRGSTPKKIERDSKRARLRWGSNRQQEEGLSKLSTISEKYKTPEIDTSTSAKNPKKKSIPSLLKIGSRRSTALSSQKEDR